MSSAAISQARTRLAGALLMAGAVIFWSGSFMPSTVVFMTPGLLNKVELIASHRTFWTLQHGFFLAGVTVTTIGLALLATVLREMGAGQLATSGLICIFLTTVVWAVATYFRLSVPAEQVTRVSDVPPLFLAALYGWLFAAFTVLTLGALIIYAAALAQTGLLKRLGRIAAILSSLMMIVAIILTVVWAVSTDFGVSPPLGGWVPEVQYLVTLLIGIGLLRRQPAGARSVSVAEGTSSAASRP
jgi:hypothetical protein